MLVSTGPRDTDAVHESVERPGTTYGSKSRASERGVIVVSA